MENQGASCTCPNRLEEVRLLDRSEDLVKHYGDVKAVDGVSFVCPDGQVTGLLGPNGAGKTTTLRMVCGLIRPMRGTVIVDGHDVKKDPQSVRRSLGVQTDSSGVYPA